MKLESIEHVDLESQVIPEQARSQPVLADQVSSEPCNIVYRLMLIFACETEQLVPLLLHNSVLSAIFKH